MNIETKDFLEKLLIEWTQGVPSSKEDLMMNDIAQITSIDIVNELCEALGIYEE